MDINSKVIFTNSDLSLIGAIKKIHTDIKHLLYIFHIDLNLYKKFKSKLVACFEEFRYKFYAYRNSLYKELFKSQWV